MAEDQAPVEEQAGNPFGDLDPRVQEDIDGLIWLGYLENQVEFCGHSFVLRTLRGEDELNAGVITKQYVETWGQARAWAWAKVALSLIAVDGDENFCPPIGPDKLNYARARFNYVTSRWYWPLGEYLYAELLDLESRQIAAIRAVQDLSNRSLPNFSPSADFSTEQGDSLDTPPEIQT